MVHCSICGTVPETNLPVVLPKEELKHLNKASPLSKNEDFINTACPKCKNP